MKGQTNFSRYNMGYLRSEVRIALCSKHMCQPPEFCCLLWGVERYDTREHHMDTT